MGPSPAAYVRAFDPQRQARDLKPIVHRWTKGDDLDGARHHPSAHAAERIDRGVLSRGLRCRTPPICRRRSNRFRRARCRPICARRTATGSRVPASAYFFSRPSCGGACKRLNLFLRWMVRSDAVDFGIWKSVPASKLVVPLDTHVIRVGRCLRIDALYEPWLEDGRRHHGVAARARSGRSGEVRLLAVPPRHGGSVRVQPRAGGFGVPAAWVCATRAKRN